jgi:cysteine synthase
MIYDYTDIIIATSKVAAEKQVAYHFVDEVTTAEQFKERIRFYDGEDWLIPNWEDEQPLTWEEMVVRIDDTQLQTALNKCKDEARKLLSESDWAATIDVQQQLENPLEWLAYREEVRRLFVNPVANPVFPTKPLSRWSI